MILVKVLIKNLKIFKSRGEKLPIFCIFLFFSTSALAECRDLVAIQVADEAALGLMSGETFLPGRVLKKHLPSQKKEVASYVRSGQLYYTVFSLVDTECKAYVIKRTQGKY